MKQHVAVATLLQAQGNTALALMLTVASNLIGIASVPFFLKAIFSNIDGVTLDAVSLLLKLLITILAPLATGKVARELVPGAPRYVKQHKIKLTLLSNVSLISTVWQTNSVAAVRTLLRAICH